MFMLRVTALLLASTLPAMTAQADDCAGLKEAVTKAWQQTRMPGAVVGVFRPGKPDSIILLGYSDAEKRVPMSADLHFRVGSISKVFVGQTLLSLIDDGLVSADDPISKYVDDVPNGDKITIRLLGNHRAGIFNIIESKAIKNLFAGDPRKWWSEDELLRYSLAAPPYFNPGEKHHYSNAHTALLARTIAKVTGRPWQDVVEERVFRRLNLKNTSIARSNDLPVPFSRGYAFGGEQTPFFVRGETRHDVTHTSPSWWGAAGNAISTLHDLSRAAKPLATGALLGSKGKRELLAWTPADQPGFEYGFHIERHRGWVGHDGDVPGFQSAMYYSPEHDTVIVGLGNVYGWSVRGMPTSVLVLAAVDHLFPQKKP
jgi:D-alanyl-D-alanine carboxypeptidase